MDHKKETIFDYRRPQGELALWWQSFFLLPLWAQVALLPLGAIVRNIDRHSEAYFISAYMVFFFFYFVYKLRARQLVIDDRYIRLGYSHYLISNLKSITMSTTRYGIPGNTINLNFDDGKESKTLGLSLFALKPDDALKLVNLLSRRVSALPVDAQVERVIKAQKPLEVEHIPNPDEIILPYRLHGFFQDLPRVFEATLASWSKVVGPVGTLIICSPLWLGTTFSIFNMLRDWADVNNNWTFYQTLASILTYFTPAAATANVSLESWLAFFPVACVVWYLLFTFVYKLLKIELSPTRLLLNRQELSLDWWSELFSVESASFDWSLVSKISLVGNQGTASPDNWKIKIEYGKKQQLNLELGAIKPEDRPKLLRSLQQFAPANTLSIEVTETLTPRAEGSYTELWLQSLSDTAIRKNLEPLNSQSRLQDGRYEVIEKLGIGGEGTAYKALDRNELWEGKVRNVVLKETIIPPYLDRSAERDAIKRIQTESLILSSIASDKVVKCLDFFIEDKRCYLVLDYIEGDNLRNIVKNQGPLPEKEALKLAIQMCEILSVLHDKQIIHRDFTPDNLMYSQDKNLKLIDFAVATEDKGGTTGTIVGKHSYVPPEQFRGHAQKASDIYAMGATLYFILTGSDPEPISVASIEDSDVEVSPFLKDLVERLTDQEAENRPSDLKELANQIEEQLEKYNIDSEDNVISIKIEERLKHG